MRRSLLIVLALLVAACGPSARQRALSTTLAALDGAREGFVSFDEITQDKILASIDPQTTSLEAAQKKIADYRAKREPVVKAFMIAYSALTTAAINLKDMSFADAIDRAADLYMAIKEFKESLATPATAPATAPAGGTP